MVANAENLPFRDAFDLIIAADIMEHVLNVGDFLLSAREAHATGGTFVVRVPFLDNMLQYARLNGCAYDMVHLRTFSRETLAHLLRQAGFTVQRFPYDEFNEGRLRPWVTRTKIRERLLDHACDRLLGGRPGLRRLSPRMARLMMEPVILTAVARGA